MMLVRSAGRRQRRHTSRVLAASFAQLQLPWLAPAQLRWAASQTTSSPSSIPNLRRGSLSKSSRPTSQLRQLATAVDQHSVNYEKQFSPPPTYSAELHDVSQDKHVPWDLSPSKASHTATSARANNGPVIINTTTVSPSSALKIFAGVTGNVRDLLAHFHTNLSIGRIDRAALIIQRLSEQYGLNAAELSYAHTAYLQELFKRLSICEQQSVQSKTAFRSMQNWFETEVRSKGVQVNSQMLIVMIRAAIREFHDASQEKLVLEYSEIARSLGPETMDEVLFSMDYSDEEFATIERVTSDFFEVEEETEQNPDNAHSDSHVEPGLVASDDRAVIDVPEVRPTPQKGLGLSGVRRTMEVFKGLPELPPDASAEAQRDHALMKQQRLEHASVEVALERWRKADEDLRKLGINTAMQSKSMSALMWQWYKALLPALEKELAETRKTLQDEGGRFESDRLHYGPYLEMLSLPSVAANTILFTMAKFAQGKDRNRLKYVTEVKLSVATVGLVKSLEQDYRADASVQKSGLAGEPRSSSQARLRKGTSHRKKLKGKSSSMSATGGTQATRDFDAHVDWPSLVRVKLGAMLISKLIESAEISVTRIHPRTGKSVTQMQPAFLHRANWQNGRKYGVLVPNPTLTEKLQSEPVGSLIAKQMPMVVEPKSWRGWADGGYLHYSNPILRLPMGDQSGKDYFIAADRKGDLERVYAGLNALGKVPWMVNPDVFRVQLEAWNSGEAIANFAPLDPHYKYPPEPDSAADSNEKQAWFAEVREIENRKMGMHSKRCFQNFQLEVARNFRNETLYFPHSLDFRGRAYPIPPYLNHMGADNVRGLVTFAEGKPLGPDGLRWLKIHVATVAGHDKASLEERVEFTMSHLDDIYDSVRSPLTGRRWWLKSEDAWQTLAACFELTKALDSPEPAEFVSHLPIQQDGTCNGLQHYAALGGDKVGAAQVNLEPGDRPSDVYTAVAEAVKREIQQDAAQGDEVARKLEGHITRKCVKQPVMTNVYGVTYYGARLQVKRQLETIFPDIKRTDKINLDHMSRYVANKIFKSLGTMFRGAQAIQTWLGQCADRVTTCLTPEQIEEYMFNGGASAKRKGRKADKSTVPARDAMSAVKPLFKSTVVWTTPLGLPVVQPYRTTKANVISTTMQHISMSEPQVWDPVSRRKQLQAFPPNFIHSLDSTHMLLSATKCNELGMTFASIHDSFWTHACDVNTMSTVLRDAFVSMHSEDIIGRLREEFQARFKGAMYLASIRTDSALGRQIKELRKRQKVKLGNGRELKLEVERLRLLESDDPEQRAKGEAMVTPASLFAAVTDAESQFAAPVAMEGQVLGEIPPAGHDDVASATRADAEKLATELDDELTTGSESAKVAADGDDYGDEDAHPQSSAKKKATYNRQYVWLPVEFPPVPQKGEFDVTRLRESKYFFH